jgi:transcription antitermination factor NusG
MAPLFGGSQLSEHGEALSRRSGTSPEPAIEQATDLGRNGPCRQWYAVRTYPRHEKRVRDHLLLRKIETFLPLYGKLSRWRNGCDAQVQLPLFPSYLFVEIGLPERTRVLDVPGAISLVGSSRGPWPLPNFQIESLRSSLHLRKFEPYAYLVAGQRVRIVAGPLANFTGILIRKNASLRVAIALDEIMQGVAVEVDARELEVIAPAGGDAARSS